MLVIRKKKKMLMKKRSMCLPLALFLSLLVFHYMSDIYEKVLLPFSMDGGLLEGKQSSVCVGSLCVSVSMARPDNTGADNFIGFV